MRPRTLKTAAAAGDLEAIKYQLDNGAKINATTVAGHHPLGSAIIHGHGHVVSFLLRSGANPNLRSQYGWTPLYIAAWKGHAGIAKQLIQAGARLQLRTKSGYNSPDRWSPLHVACANGFLTVVKVLVKAGARTDSKDGSQRTPLAIALMHNETAIGGYLTRIAKISEKKERMQRGVADSSGKRRAHRRLTMEGKR